MGGSPSGGSGENQPACHMRAKPILGGAVARRSVGGGWLGRYRGVRWQRVGAAGRTRSGPCDPGAASRAFGGVPVTKVQATDVRSLQEAAADVLLRLASAG